MNRYIRLFSLLILAIFKTTQPLNQVAIIFIGDQLSHRAFEKAAPHTVGGIREFIDNGILYNNAYFPYARTSTGPGHATINTGTLPKIHGIIANYWYNENNKKIASDHDDNENLGMFSPKGIIKKGKSAFNMKADGISDQIMMASTPDEKNFAMALSLKSRAAIFSAGQLGKAIWFDTKHGGKFTSSKAYYNELPSWLTKFNKKLHGLKTAHWTLQYPQKSKAYNFAKLKYGFSRLPTLIDKTVSLDFYNQDKHKKHHKYDPFIYSPQSNKVLLDLAEEYLKETLAQKPNKILLWISLSSLDKVGHIFGSDSLEYIDTIYHIDHYLAEFMAHVRSIIPENKIIFALMADHGSTPIVEYLKEEKCSLAHRILVKPLEQEINQHIEQQYGVKNCIKEIGVPSIFLNHEELALVKTRQKNKIIRDIKTIFRKQPGIKQIWTYDDLAHAPCYSNDFTSYYKNQLFPGRSGALIYQTYPYTCVSKGTLGTDHESCYDYTTHVPLLIYQPGKTSKRTIKDRVSMTQFAPTLAQKLSIPSPSACLENPLPEK